MVSDHLRKYRQKPSSKKYIRLINRWDIARNQIFHGRTDLKTKPLHGILIDHKSIILKLISLHDYYY